MNDDKLLVMDKMMQSLISARAAWEKDGGGVRGPQESRSAQQAQAANRENSLKYSSNNSRRDPEQTDFGGRLTTPDAVASVGQSSSKKATYGPFQTIISTITSGGAPQTRVGVSFISTLFKNAIDYTSDTPITGLLASTSPIDSDPGWKTVTGGESVYLEIAFTTGAFSTATIKVDSTYIGGLAVAHGDTEFDTSTPPTQTFARKLLGEVDSNLVIAQNVFSNLGLTALCANGQVIQYPIPT